MSELQRVSKREFYGAVYAWHRSDPMPSVDGSTLRDSLIASDWYTRYPRRLFGVSKLGLTGAEYYLVDQFRSWGKFCQLDPWRIRASSNR